MNDMTEIECRIAWEKHQKNAHEDDMMSYSEFRSNCGLRDEEEFEDAWDAEFLGMAKGVEDFNRVYEIFCKGKRILPNGLVCPALYCEQREITLCVFENSQK